MQLLCEREPSCILHVAAVGDVGHRADPLPRVVVEPDTAQHLAVDARHLLAGAQIFDGGLAVLLPDSERHPLARPAAIETEHQSWPLRRSPMHKRIDAERAMFADQLGAARLQVFKARAPDQRAIAEEPEIIFGNVVRLDGSCGHFAMPTSSDIKG